MTKLRDLATKRGERLWFAPDKIKIDPFYNLRDLGTPQATDALEVLAASLKESGMRVPLLVRLEGEECVLVQGHRRKAAIDMLIARGVPWESVECVAEEKRRSAEDRTLDLFLSNDGEPLTELEKAEGVRRLIQYGWDHAKIAAKLGRTVSYVSALVGYERMPEQVKEMVRDGVVSASAAHQTLRSEGEANGTAILQEARHDAEREAEERVPPKTGAEKPPKAAKVTPKRIEKIRERREPTITAPKAPALSPKLDDALISHVSKFLVKCQNGSYEDEENEVPNRLAVDAKDLAETINLYRKGFVGEAAE